MRVAVTGATGNLGTALLERLAHDPEVTSVLALSRREPAVLPPNATWSHLDMSRDRDLRSAFDGVDAVVLLAWIFQPTRDPVRTWNTNVRGSLRVFDAVARAGVEALEYASSIGAYAPGPRHDSVDESWPVLLLDLTLGDEDAVPHIPRIVTTCGEEGEHHARTPPPRDHVLHGVEG